MKIFVAGGTGVLGRALIPLLVQAGHQVRTTARGSEKMNLASSLGAQPAQVNLFDPPAVRKAIGGADAVIRITTKFGSMAKLRDPRTWQDTIRLRTEGARILVEAATAEGVQAYLHESVSWVYADGGRAWLSENSPIDDGGVSIMRATIEGERIAQRFSLSGGRGIVLRFGGFYGPDAPSTLESVNMARRRLFFRFGPARNYFSSVYIPDAASAAAALLNAPAGIYNVVDDDPVTFAEYVETLAKAVGAPRPRHLPKFLGRLAFGEMWKYLSRSQRVSNGKLKHVCGWEPEVKNVRQGWARIASMLAEDSPQRSSGAAA
jgi:nucleoside-diphosphate-sugar epimerase